MLRLKSRFTTVLGEKKIRHSGRKKVASFKYLLVSTGLEEAMNHCVLDKPSSTYSTLLKESAFGTGSNCAVRDSLRTASSSSWRDTSFPIPSWCTLLKQVLKSSYREKVTLLDM